MLHQNINLLMSC